MINFVNQNKKLLIITIINIILLQLMHILKINYIISEAISLFIIFTVYEKKINKKIFTSLAFTLFIEIIITNFLIKYNLPYIVLNVIISVFLLLFIYDKEQNYKKIKKTYTYLDIKCKKIIKNKKLFNFLPQNIITFILLIISLFTVYKYCTNFVSDTGVVYFNEPSTQNILINKKTKVDLSFIDSKEKFDHMCFKIEAEDINTKISLLYSNINKTMKAKKINRYGYLCFKTAGIKSDYFQKNDIYLSSNKEIKLFKSTKNELAVQLSRKQNSDLIIIDITLSIIIILLFLIINYIINKKKLPETKMYLIFSSYFLLLLFIFPPFQVPDEVVHFNRAYNYSQPKINEKTIFGKNNIIVPKNIDCIDYAHVQRSNKIYQIDDITNCIKNTKNKSIINTEKTGSQILGYITQSIGIKIADTLTNSPLIIFFSGRLLTLIISATITFLAIKITPKFKLIFLTVGTMMMLIQQMISYSYDSILNSACLLLVAYIIKLIYKDTKITIKNMIIPILLLIVIINVKIVYLPLALLLLLIPKSKFKNKYITILLIVLISLLSSKIIENIFYVPSNNITNNKQLQYLINNPLDIFTIAFNTITKKSLFYIESLVGYFGWFMIKLSPIYIYIYIFLFIYLINGENCKKTKKIIIILSLLMMIISIFGALYIVWSNYRLSYVEGVQGRYLIPLIIPFCLLFIPNKKKYKINKKIVYSIINILLLQYLFIILFTFY